MPLDDDIVDFEGRAGQQPKQPLPPLLHCLATSSPPTQRMLAQESILELGRESVNHCLVVALVEDADRGESVIPIVLAALAWGDKWLAGEDGPPAIAVHNDHDCTAVVVCQSCGEPIVAAEISSAIGPGGRPGPGTNLIGTRMAWRENERSQTP